MGANVYGIAGALAPLVPTAVQTGAYTATPQQLVLCSTSGGAFSVTLPSAPADQTRVAVMLTAGTATVTVHAGGSDVINPGGGTTWPVSAVAQCLALQYDATLAAWITMTGTGSAAGALLAANNLSDLASDSSARSNLGLGLPATVTTTPAASQTVTATSTTAAGWVTRDFNAMAFGATGNGTTDDTTAIQAALTAAGSAKGSVYLPAPSGGCYRTSGLSVPSGVVAIRGDSALYRSNGPTVTYLQGSVLAPLSSSVTALLTVGTSGSGSVNNSNPHGLKIEGLGFLGVTPSGSCIPGMFGVVVTDTSDVTMKECRSLYCDCNSSALSGSPSGGSATGGIVQLLSSGSGNGFSENFQWLNHRSFGDGKLLVADGISSGNGGTTDGKISGLQANSFYRGLEFGPVNAGTGGFSITDAHFSSSIALHHINYGSAGTPWTLRVTGSYFDTCSSSGPHILCNGRGLQCVNNYFRAGLNTLAIKFGSGLTTHGRDPAATIVGNDFDLNGSTTVTCFAQFADFTALNVAADAGGIYTNNVAHNHGSAMPGSWLAQFIGSDSAAVAATSTGSLTLTQGSVLTA